MEVYAWDIWMIFAPGVKWEGRLPPEPSFWMHQLGNLGTAPRLDVDKFAGKVREYQREGAP